MKKTWFMRRDDGIVCMTLNGNVLKLAMTLWANAHIVTISRWHSPHGSLHRLKHIKSIEILKSLNLCRSPKQRRHRFQSLRDLFSFFFLLFFSFGCGDVTKCAVGIENVKKKNSSNRKIACRNRLFYTPTRILHRYHFRLSSFSIIHFCFLRFCTVFFSSFLLSLNSLDCIDLCRCLHLLAQSMRKIPFCIACYRAFDFAIKRQIEKCKSESIRCRHLITDFNLFVHFLAHI